MVTKDCPWFSAHEGRCLEYVSDTPQGDSNKCSRCGLYMVLEPSPDHQSLPEATARGMADLWERIKAESSHDHANA